MRHRQSVYFLIGILLSAFLLPASADDIITGSDNLGVDVSRVDGRIAMDLLGSIWILPANGGQATIAADGQQQASRPRWSPDGKKILYQIASGEGTGLWLLEIDSLKSDRVSSPLSNDQFASWHPQGNRIVFAAVRDGTDFDVWETDLPTGLSWRLTNDPGDEFEPVWSANGRDLAYIRKYEDQYALTIRRRGRPAFNLLVTDEPLSSISWRPDGTLLTYLRGRGDTMRLEMAILSEPPLIREFASGEAFSPSPVSWLDRSQHVYAADGAIKTRAFGDWRPRPLPFRAFVARPESRSPATVASHDLEIFNPPEERLVIRGARLFDGIWSSYRENMDVLIAGGKIIAVEPRRDWPDATVLDPGNVTIMPGLIDTWSNIPPGSQHRAGLTLLAYGITTIVSDQQIDSFEQAHWDTELTPGPRLLRALNLAGDTDIDNADSIFLASISSLPANENADLVRSWQERGVPIVAENWNTHVSADADLLLGVESLPRHSQGDRYRQDRYGGNNIAGSTQSVTVISGLADASTPGIDALLHCRQARELNQTAIPARRYPVTPQIFASSATILAGSKPNGLPAGMALHAELRALQAAGLSGEQVLHTAGKNPAKVLGIENQIGSITPGALADMILVSGDPLNNVEDALNIVAVVRNGRFFSLVRLLEQANATSGVE